jgi:hypothetical protein
VTAPDTPPAVRLGCVHHGHHDVAPYDAARIAAALIAELLHLAECPEDHHHVKEPCPLHDVLEWAGDSEMYAEHVEARLLLAPGVYVEDPETGEVTHA